MLLARGKVIYFNKAELAVDHFTGISDATRDYRCPEMSNPADFFMKIMSIESIELAYMKTNTNQKKAKAEQDKEVAEEYRNRIEWFVEQYESSNLVTDGTAAAVYPRITDELLAKYSSKTTWCYEF